ncbi:probable E3 ubiquitin-protein ligase DTX2 isoform X2 [Homarus americanus]|uniref:probable E3 ubiquitin-protein ligase DTX2 isoform X2 n=1 Tax=Homarus americanus TaxID=6706 RepID=UPI001C48FCF2|nr:probable E3 ubiquitin-protein ligase DTX2 isoform X2 [Homarus americanus]
MATGKQGLFVVVWEWENKQRRWRPYSPEVTQQLERSHTKNLRSVFLGDSDPALKNYCVHLPEMEQKCTASGETVRVRRNFYPQSSPAGQGAVWQWAGDACGDWHVYDMCVQCIIEESWATGAQTVDMSCTFPLCPYVINFCNLTQMNSRTGFIRSIRRFQQAAYPVGRRPVTPQQSHVPGRAMTTSNNNSNNPFNNTRSTTMSPLGAGSTDDRPRRRGSRGEERDASSSDTKPRTLMNKVFGRGHGSNSNNRGGNMNPPVSSDVSNGRLSSQWNGRDASPPKPMPRTNVPPVPKPRSNVPPPKHHQHHPSLEQHQHFSDHQHNQRQHLLEDQEEQRTYMARGLSRPPSRNESAMGRFGSNHTLDSDCSSLNSGRRPSVDTTSTYLSLESFTVEDDHPQSLRHDNPAEAGATCSPVVDKLIKVDSDESMDDDVFSEDQEVCDVMRGVADHSSPPRAPSPLTLSHSHHQHQYSRHSVPHHTQNQSTPQQQSHFMPINAALPSSDVAPQMNGVKRKWGQQTMFGHPHMGASGDGNNDEVSQNSRFYGKQNQHRFSHHRSQHGSRAPIAAEDQLLVQHTSVVTSPPDEMCSICMWSLQEPSGYSDEDEAVATPAHTAGLKSDGVVSLVLCDHLFHLACVRQMAKASPQFLECPNCKTLHGEKIGNQPNGRMDVISVSGSLPGHPNCNTIQITYNINNGVQGPEHPRPGRPYHAVGFPRIAYLPNSEKGKKVLKLLREAWRRRLVFTIGTSVTMGIQDAVTWNEIHHKTEWTNYNGHGYPDPNYLDNVLKELALHGVTETTLV